jgi:trehalose-6-phosphate synthase
MRNNGVVLVSNRLPITISAEELKCGAIIVNPHDIRAVKSAVSSALARKALLGMEPTYDERPESAACVSTNI